MRLSDGGSRAMVGRRQWRLWRITDVSLELMMRCWGKAEVLGLRQEHRGVWLSRCKPKRRSWKRWPTPHRTAYFYLRSFAQRL